MRLQVKQLFAVFLCIGCACGLVSCFDKDAEPDEPESPYYTDCRESNSSVSASHATMLDKSWAGKEFKTWISNTKPFRIECKKGSDSLVITFWGRIPKTVEDYATTPSFYLVLRNTRVAKFEQLRKLEGKMFSLNDSSAYLVFNDFNETFFVQDSIKVTSGIFKFKNAYSVCGVLYSGAKAIQMDGAFAFNVDSAGKRIPVNGGFSFFVTPFDDEVLIGY